MSIQNRCSILLLLICGLAAPALADQASVDTDASVGTEALCLKMRMEGFAKPDLAKYDAAVKRYHPKLKKNEKKAGGDDGSKDG